MVCNARYRAFRWTFMFYGYAPKRPYAFGGRRSFRGVGIANVNF